MYNEEYVQAVLNKKAVIEHTRNKEDNPKLIALLKHIFPDANYPISNEYNHRYYGAYKLNNQYWDNYYTVLKGMEIIPLNNFII